MEEELIDILEKASENGKEIKLEQFYNIFYKKKF